MIFVTVGTHEQPFNRLIKKIDELKQDGTIEEDVIIQTGFSTYEPKYCQWSKLIPYQQMVKNVADARIVITHGGPASFVMPLQIGKTPIVVPRQHQFDEHVNDHQVDFSRNVAQRMGTIILVEDIETLGDIIKNYDQIVAGMNHGLSSNNYRSADSRCGYWRRSWRLGCCQSDGRIWQRQSGRKVPGHEAAHERWRRHSHRYAADPSALWSVRLSTRDRRYSRHCSIISLQPSKNGCGNF